MGEFNSLLHFFTLWIKHNFIVFEVIKDSNTESERL
jgi:hypothetical protein